MNFIQKKLCLAWRKFCFLLLPIEKRVRLEVEQDGRHLTFLLVALYEAGYGVQVFASPAVFRELICLKESAPIPFVIGGKERECGISITDKSGFNHRGHREHVGVRRVLLDYNYFSGLNKGVVSHGGTANTELSEDLGKNESRENFNHNRERGHVRERATEGWPVGRESGSEREYTRIEAEQAGQRLAGQAGAAFSNPSTSELARDAENTSPTRTANDPTAPGEYSSSVLIRDIRGQNASLPATSHSPLDTALRAPYFMHPSVYHRGLHKSRLPTRHSPPVTRHSAEGASHPPPVTSSPQRHRRFRIGFFGTHDREFYTAHYHFPGMNRFEILEAFFEKFGDSFVNLEGPTEQWPDSKIVVAIDGRGGDRQGKSFLSQENYFAALRECDFVLSPPGWCIPISHNLIEAMFCGAIPITNGGAFMAEPLADDVNCLAFKNVEELAAVVERALAMDVGEVERMRWAVLDYYERFLEPNAFGERFIRTNSTRIFVNAEENSLPLVFPGIIFPWDVPKEAPGRGEEVSGANL
jgi:hypothetical protein